MAVHLLLSVAAKLHHQPLTPKELTILMHPRLLPPPMVHGNHELGPGRCLIGTTLRDSVMLLSDKHKGVVGSDGTVRDGSSGSSSSMNSSNGTGSATGSVELGNGWAWVNEARPGRRQAKWGFVSRTVGSTLKVGINTTAVGGNKDKAALVQVGREWGEAGSMSQRMWLNVYRHDCALGEMCRPLLHII
jgi:hypothetical protein